jgi:hypothetical protein
MKHKHKQHLNQQDLKQGLKQVLTRRSKKRVLKGSSKKGVLNHTLATISLTAFTLATLSLATLSLDASASPRLGQRKPLYIPKIENVKQAKKAYLRSKRYQAQLEAWWDRINTWGKLQEAVRFTPWCRIGKPKSKTAHLQIWHYDSHGKIKGRYGMHVKAKLMSKDRLFMRSKCKLKVCAAPYNVSVLHENLYFDNYDGKPKVIVWTDILLRGCSSF